MGRTSELTCLRLGPLSDTSSDHQFELPKELGTTLLTYHHLPVLALSSEGFGFLLLLDSEPSFHLYPLAKLFASPLTQKKELASQKKGIFPISFCSNNAVQSRVLS